MHYVERIVAPLLWLVDSRAMERKDRERDGDDMKARTGEEEEEDEEEEEEMKSGEIR